MPFRLFKFPLAAEENIAQASVRIREAIIERDRLQSRGLRAVDVLGGILIVKAGQK